MSKKILALLAAIVCVSPLAALAQGGSAFDAEAQNGYGGDKVTICYHEQTRIVSKKLAELYAKWGATMGACAPGTIVIVKNANGGDGTFSFKSSSNDLADFTITTVNGSGSATLTVPEGKYNISETNQADWKQNYNGCRYVIVRPGQTATCAVTNTKINRYGSISGSTLVDFDTDGKNVNSFFNRLPGVTVYLDANNNGALDSGERSTVSNFFGAYSFNNVPHGITYHVRQVVPAGYTQLSPAGAYDKYISPNERAKNLNFVDYNPNRTWWN